MNDSGKKHTVLFVDDEPRITSVLKALFRREYKVLTANSGSEALELLEQFSTLEQKQVDVMVSDQRMPGMLGSELLATVSRIYPRTMRILLTGFIDREAIVDSINEGEIYRFINKPWDNIAMRLLLAEATEASDLPVETVFLGDGSMVEEKGDDVSEAVYEDKVILLVEKKQGVRRQISQFCRAREIMVYDTENVEEAISIATTRDNVGVVVIDLSGFRPDQTLQAINLLKQVRPDLITIVLTDEYDAKMAVDLINQGQVFKYLARPVSVQSLYKTIDAAFRRHLYFKDNTESQQRHKVDKPTGSIDSNLQGIFDRLGARS
ncbi:MAG: response regulator [Arenicella sp.]|nr:response regulator [Arenicella sp.]